MALWRLSAGNTHLFPGARLCCLEKESDARFAAGDDVIVEFSDGNVVRGRVAEAAPGTVTLAMDAHRTMRGAPIGEKRWALRPAAGGTIRVVARR